MRLATHEDRVKYATGLIYLSWPFLMCGTMTFFAIRLIGPRPRFFRLLHQPGAVARFTSLAYIVTSYIVSQVIADLANLRMPTLLMGEEERGQLTMAICQAGVGAGYAVASAWFLLVLSRRRCRWPGWIDAWGVLLGVCWIAWSVSCSISPHF